MMHCVLISKMTVLLQSSPEIECIINASSVEKPSDHWNIYKAIAEHDEEKARRLMKQHIRNIIDAIDAYEESQADSSGI